MASFAVNIALTAVMCLFWPSSTVSFIIGASLIYVARRVRQHFSTPPDTQISLAAQPLSSSPQNRPPLRPTQSAPAAPAASQKSGCGFLESYSETKYRAFARSLTDKALLAKEESKMTAKVSAGMSLAGGAATTAATGGITAPLIGIAARQGYLAKEKLDVIREEMGVRGMKKRGYSADIIAKGSGPAAVKAAVGMA